MHKFVRALLLVLFFGTVFAAMAQAQPPRCTAPDPATYNNEFGFYPNDSVVPAATVGQYYEQVVDFVAPVQLETQLPTGGTITVTLTKIELVDIKNLAAGLSYQTNLTTPASPPTWTAPGGGVPATGCVTIYGTPTEEKRGPVPTQDSILIIVRGYARVLGIEQNALDTITYFVTVNAASAGINDYVSGGSFGVAPNPLSTNSKISYNLVKTTDVSLNVIDMAGRTVRSINFNQQLPGYYEQDLNLSELTAGIYVVNFSVGDYTTSKKVFKAD